MLTHDEEEETGGEGCVPLEVAAAAAAGRYSRFHAYLTRTYSHTADRHDGLDLQYEIPFQQMGNMMNHYIMYDECQLALGCSERFISVKPTHSTCSCEIETDLFQWSSNGLLKYTVVRYNTSERSLQYSYNITVFTMSVYATGKVMYVNVIVLFCIVYHVSTYCIINIMQALEYNKKCILHHYNQLFGICLVHYFKISLMITFYCWSSLLLIIICEVCLSLYHSLS